MRWGLVVIAGCSFRPGSLATSDGGATDIDANPDDVMADGPTDGSAAPCATTKVWLADFTADPTTQNLNGDGVNDWAMRDMGALAGTLTSGIWAEPGTPTRPLDSQPKQDFATRTRVNLRMRNPVAPTGAYAAVFWINVDYTATTFAPLYVDVRRTSNPSGQLVRLFGKSDAATEVVLAQAFVTPYTFFNLALDISPATNQVIMTIETVAQTATYTEIPRNGNDDRWATAVAYGADAEFDVVRVEVCSP